VFLRIRLRVIFLRFSLPPLLLNDIIKGIPCNMDHFDGLTDEHDERLNVTKRFPVEACINRMCNFAEHIFHNAPNRQHQTGPP